MNVTAEIARRVEARAGGRCEYCRMHPSLQGATFHVEHILPRSRGGESGPDNLAWACPSCNLHKSNRTVADDPAGGTAPLFHPRRDMWTDHFRFDGFESVGLTPVGRATIEALHFNDERRRRIREAEQAFDLFPP